MSNSKRRPRPQENTSLLKLMADISAGDQVTRLLTEDGRDLAAVMLGRLGGLKGGTARAASLSPERRREIAIKAARSRWGKNDS